MWKLRPIHALAIAALAVVYYASVHTIMPRMPFVDLPSWWRIPWPSRRIDAFTWLQTVQVGGAILAAIPVALAIAWGATSRRFVVALAVAAPTALSTLMFFVDRTIPATASSPLVMLAVVVTFLSYLLAVPLVVAISHAFRWRRHSVAPRQSV